MKAVALRTLTFCLLILVVFSCQKKDLSIEDQLIGKWILTDKSVDNVSVTLGDCEKQSTIEFQVNNYCLLYDGCSGRTTNSGWIYQYEMLNISEQLPAAFYIEHLDVNTLKVRRNDISPGGSLQVTVLSYAKP